MIVNKYYKIYNQIINNRKNNIPEGYTENHHIIPKSLGGSDDPENLITLTAREHYICHYLLTKFTTGQNYYSMVYAFNMMHVKSKNQERTLNSLLYEKNKLKLAEHRSEMMKGENNPNWGKTGENHHNWGKKRPEHSEAMKGENNPFFGKKHTPEALEKISKKVRGENHPNWGKSPSEETRKKKSEALKGKKQKKVECPYCGKVGGITNMKRYHFDNCKFKVED